MGVNATDMGVMTTPQLHWMVHSRNKGMEASENNYYDQLSTSFRLVSIRFKEVSFFKLHGLLDKIVYKYAFGCLYNWPGA